MGSDGFVDTDIDIAELLEDSGMAWAEFIPETGKPYSEEWERPRENWREYENQYAVEHGAPSFVENNGRVEYSVPVRYAHEEVDIGEWQGMMVLGGYIREEQVDKYTELLE